MRWRDGLRVLLLGCLLSFVSGGSAAAQSALPGDLNGDGTVAADDEEILRGLYGTDAGEPGFDPAADVDGDGRIDHRDLALFGAAFGQGGGAVDVTPPALFVTLNDLPDDMNDLVVVPPGGFRITLAFDASGGSALDAASLSVASDQDLGALPAGSELGALFAVGPTRAVLQVPAGSDLARTTHRLTVSVRDHAGNEAQAEYGFAVRDFPFGAPLGALQTFLLDFDRDRSLATGAVDFLEDLREFGLSSAAAPGLEGVMRDWAVAEITARANAYYGRADDGSPGADALNVMFTAQEPTGTYSRLCVGGQSSLGSLYLGASILDVHNLDKTSDDCASPQYGVFPNALDDLWSGHPEWAASIGPLDPGLGGTPVGADPLDAVVLAPGFDLATATSAESLRFGRIANAVDVFSQAVATGVAHEAGHLLGLTAPGPLPGGLYGGQAGANHEHNVEPGGGVPASNFLMNQGGAFNLSKVTGRNGQPLPVFRPVSLAYLRGELVLSDQVTGLYDAPELSSVEPDPLELDPPVSATVTIHGANFLPTPRVDLIDPGSPTAKQLQNVVVVDPQTLTATANMYVVPPGLYDVRVQNPDGQVVILPAGLEVR